MRFKVLKENIEQVDSEGNPLSPEQVAFFRSSKVRDSNGRLLVCYHGTNVEFTTFDSSKASSSSGQMGADMGYWFTPVKSVAKKFASRPSNGAYNNYFNSRDKIEKDFANRVYVIVGKHGVPLERSLTYLWLNAEELSKKFSLSPKEIDELKSIGAEYFEFYNNGDITPFLSQQKSYVMPVYLNITKMKTLRGEDIGVTVTRMGEIDNAVQQHYNGVLIKDGDTGAGICDEYVVFKSNQIKSVTNKNPTNSNNINEHTTTPLKRSTRRFNETASNLI